LTAIKPVNLPLKRLPEYRAAKKRLAELDAIENAAGLKTVENLLLVLFSQFLFFSLCLCCVVVVVVVVNFLRFSLHMRTSSMSVLACWLRWPTLKPPITGGLNRARKQHNDYRRPWRPRPRLPLLVVLVPVAGRELHEEEATGL
jgi:hypothetical protein